MFYTATMEYRFKPEYFDQGCRLWRDMVLEDASGQEGFVRMQLLVSAPVALAVGTWETQAHAAAYMQTGVFKRLKERLSPWLNGEPAPRVWELFCFVEKTDKGYA